MTCAILITCLAASEVLPITMASASILGNCVVVAFQVWMKQKFDKYDKLEETVKTQAEEAIRQEIKIAEHRLNTIIAPLEATVQQITKRLSHGDGTFEALTKRDHELELKFNARIDDLKDWMRTNCASKEDLKTLLKLAKEHNDA